ncbi:hypothetical protein [Cognatishimia sp.]|uniref:hypothetical protein n=1 Tax=Cognatishimia sp. TaxID=2211648 RepID=UPI00351686C0
MKHVSLVFGLVLAAPIAVADDHTPLSVKILNGSEIILNTRECPEGHICIEGSDASNLKQVDLSDTNRALMIPEWSFNTSMAYADSSGLGKDNINSYLKGISDKGILDICAYCFCCEIETGDGQRSPYLGNLQDYLD